MNGMNRSSATLPPGFRFYPTDELIIHYLKQKVSPSSNPLISIIADVNIYKFNPWELPGSIRMEHVRTEQLHLATGKPLGLINQSSPLLDHNVLE
ncbi:hypothetical protein CRYUN_Cryun31cG0033700 [Craigia yunnanensis]